jgi:hypothetical protein
MIAITVTRKPPSEGTVAANVLKHGCGAINIDRSRIPHSSEKDLAAHAAQVASIKQRGSSMQNSWKNSSDLSGASDVSLKGRWPANVILSYKEDPQQESGRRVVFESCSDLSDASRFFKQVKVSE